VKKLPKLLLLLSFFASILIFTLSCSRKTGCPMNDPARVGAKANGKGQFKAGKSRSSLFPKDMRKKKKKN